MAIRTLLVVGKNHEEIAAKYSLDTKVDKYLKCRFDEAEDLKNKHMGLIEKIISNKQIKLNNNQKEIFKNMYLDLKEMEVFDYYVTVTKGCVYDEVNGDAYTTENPNAHYQYQRCPQKALEVRGQEADFSNPFKLTDGSISYTATKGEIEWDKMHKYNTELYARAYELAVEDAEPQDEQEKRIKERMQNRQNYFNNFSSKEEYVDYSCSFWTYGIAFEDNYYELDYTVSDKDWVVNYYDNFIKDLPDDETLTIYEIKTLD